MTKILITGSRSITNKKRIFEILKEELKEEDTVITGGASGVDRISEEYCKNNNIRVITIRPLDVSRKEDYLYRNAEMIGMADRVIALWNGVSTGAKFTINYAKKRGKDVKVFEFP